MSWYKTNYYTEDPFRTHPLLLQLPPRERGTLFQDHGRFQCYHLNIILFQKNLVFLQTEGRAVLGTNFNCLPKEAHFDIYHYVKTTCNSLDLSSCAILANVSAFCYFEPTVILN